MEGAKLSKIALTRQYRLQFIAWFHGPFARCVDSASAATPAAQPKRMPRLMDDFDEAAPANVEELIKLEELYRQ